MESRGQPRSSLDFPGRVRPDTCVAARARASTAQRSTMRQTCAASSAHGRRRQVDDPVRNAQGTARAEPSTALLMARGAGRRQLAHVASRFGRLTGKRAGTRVSAPVAHAHAGDRRVDRVGFRTAAITRRRDIDPDPGHECFPPNPVVGLARQARPHASRAPSTCHLRDDRPGCNATRGDTSARHESAPCVRDPRCMRGLGRPQSARSRQNAQWRRFRRLPNPTAAQRSANRARIPRTRP